MSAGEDRGSPADGFGGRPPDGSVVGRAVTADAAELLVLQRCCWVQEAIANETLDIPALHESLDDVRAWIDDWSTWCVRVGGRLVGAVRARQEGPAWDIGRLMVAPDLAGRGLGRWLLRFAEAQAPDGVDTIVLFTGARSVRNIAMYERAGFRRTGAPARPAPSASKAGRYQLSGRWSTPRMVRRSLQRGRRPVRRWGSGGPAR